MKPADQPSCDGSDGSQYIQPGSKDNKDLEVQLVLSLLLGVSALITFCILRTRWPTLYAARRLRMSPKVQLPALSDSFFAWIPKLYKVSEEELLAAAGLDAFVFLNFFSMATKLFTIMSFFALVVLWPINAHYRNFLPISMNGTTNESQYWDDPLDPLYRPTQITFQRHDLDAFKDKPKKDMSGERTFLWAYVVFTYFFVGLTIYYINKETFRVIKYRQDYLGTQSTVTDRTFRLTGIPNGLRSEGRIKHLIDKLDIGTVEKVIVCRDWKELDDLMATRDEYLRKLETSWAKLLQQREKSSVNGHQSRRNGNANTDPDQASDEEAGEAGRLLGASSEQPYIEEGDRPQIKVRYGFMGYKSRLTDAIDYYEEKLRRLDADITEARKSKYQATDMALVTMETVASCQMVIQARIDPRPGRLITKPTPAPSDLVWGNTYAPRGVRRLKSWVVTVFITVLTLIWIFPTAFLASLASFCTIQRWLPGFAAWLGDHAIFYSIVQNGLPTLVVSLLNVAVPYLYAWLSNCQGMISQGDVELSVISKNFFFTFFNTFFVFAISRTGLEFWNVLRDVLKDTSTLPAIIARDVEDLSVFYIAFIMLQGIGLMPFRLLEVGSVVTTPIYKWMSVTPRDYSELKQPPAFQYGFYLPTAVLVFNLCLIYSVLRWGFAILIFGTIYFALGYMTFKYMVLYAMDQPQHSTGGAWRIICYRIVIGLLVFEVVMIGQIASLLAWVQSVSIFPLIPLTIWYSYYYSRRFDSLTKYIALRAIRADVDPVDAQAMDEDFEDEVGPRPSQGLLRRGSTLDEVKEKGMIFINPSLVIPLQQAWIYDDPPPPLSQEDSSTGSNHGSLLLPNADTSMGLGEDNVWSDSRNHDV